MTYKNIEILFFSKIPSLLKEITFCFSGETEFRYKSFSILEELFCSYKESSETVIILDLCNNTFELDLIIKTVKLDIQTLNFIFIMDDNQLINYVQTRQFISYETILKPLNVNELFLKIRALAERFRQLDDLVICLRQNYFYLRTNELKNGKGDIIRLTEKEAKIIDFLYKEKGQILPKDVLLKRIWGYNDSVSTHTLETHIYRLRKKIALGLGDTGLILKNKRGYYLNLVET